MSFSSRTALCAPSHPATQAAVISRVAPSGCLSVAVTLSARLLEGDELGVPLHRQSPVAELVAHDPLVVVLTQDENERIRSDEPAGVAERDVRHPAAFGPDIRARAALAELERAIDEAELRVDLQRARLHAQRPRLARRPGMTVDDERAHAAPAELIGEHQPGRAGTDDQNVSVHERSLRRSAQERARIRRGTRSS